MTVHERQEEERSTPARPSPHSTRQSILYCPYCAEETLFPLEEGGWECRSCSRAFSITFLGLRSRPGPTVKENS